MAIHIIGLTTLLTSKPELKPKMIIISRMKAIRAPAAYQPIALPDISLSFSNCGYFSTAIAAKMITTVKITNDPAETYFPGSEFAVKFVTESKITKTVSPRRLYQNIQQW